MAWIQRTKRADGTLKFWVRDVRNGKQVVIDSECATEAEALRKKEEYEIRRDLEKEGYDDQYTEEQNSLIDQVLGRRREILRRAGDN